MKKQLEASSPKRLSLLRVDKISYPKGADCPVVTVTFEYEPTSRQQEREMVNALTAVYALVENKND